MNNFQINHSGSRITNFLVAFSNIFGLITLYDSYPSGNIFGTILLLLAVISSILMHISETKHNLPGIMFVKYSSQLLWIERIVSCISAVYIAFVIFNKSLFTYDLLFDILMGLSLNFVSENVVNKQIDFILFHSLWHYYAFKIFKTVINK